jgi:hypothetical protein
LTTYRNFGGLCKHDRKDGQQVSTYASLRVAKLCNLEYLVSHFGPVTIPR